MRATGVITWRATDAYGYPGLRDDVAAAYNTGSPYSQSLGNVMAGYGVIREALPGETPDIEVVAADNAYVAAKCGGSFATACVDILSQTFPIHIWVSAPKMLTYTLVGRYAVLEHELWHPEAHACDQYIGGCPPTQGRAFQCTSNPDTLMDCNGAARYPVVYDMDSFFGVYLSPPMGRCNLGQPAPCVGLDVANAGVYVCGVDFRATIISFAFDDGVQGDGQWFYSYEGSAVTNLGNGCVGVKVTLIPGRCIYAISNNRTSWPNWQPWQLAGCT